MDLFEEYLFNHSELPWMQRALTDPSYNAYKKRGVRKGDPCFAEVQKDLPVNTHLATLGDAIIKFIYTDFLLDEVSLLTIEKSKLESDERLVFIGEHYDLIKFIKKDPEDPKLPDDYEYADTPGSNKNRHKYIATCVEAIIGAIYKESTDKSAILCDITELLIDWTKF